MSVENISQIYFFEGLDWEMFAIFSITVYYELHI